MHSARGTRMLLIFCALMLFRTIGAFAQPYDFWQPMLHTEALQWPVPGHVVQFSSYARNGGNGDIGNYNGVDFRGWNLLCDVHGTGVITNMWVTRMPLADTNRVRIFVDVNDSARWAIDTPLVRLFGHVSPFTPPLADSASGSWYCHLPIPFQSRCFISYRGTPIYFHVEALALDAGRTVTPFTMPPSAPYLAKLDSLRTRLLNPAQPAWVTRTFQVVDTQATVLFDAGPTALVTRNGPGGLRRLFVRLNSHTQATLESIWMRIFTDDAPFPDLSGPLSALLGAAQGAVPYRSAFTGMIGDSLYLNLPISYAKNLRVEIWNRTLEDYPVQVIAEIAALSPADIGPYKVRGDFHLENPTRSWSPYVPLTTTGAGCFLGMLLDMQGPSTQVLEGDETMFVNGSTQPFWRGTGTDNYFLGGYFWAGGVGRTPLGFQGLTHFSGANIAAYRWQVCDPVPFQTGFAMNFEVGPYGQIAGNYRSMAFYFAERRKWEVADSTGDGQSQRGEALRFTGHHIPPGTMVSAVRWGTTDLSFVDSLQAANADSILTFAARAPLGFQQGCELLTVQTGSHRDTVSPFCWTHLAGPELTFFPHRIDLDTSQTRGDTLDVEIRGVQPGATAQLFAGGYELPWAGAPPTAGGGGFLHGPAVLEPPLSPGNYEIRASSAGSPGAISDRLVKLRSFYRMEVEEMDTAGYFGTALQSRFAADYAPSGNTDPWGRGLVRYLQGTGVGTFVTVRFAVAVADTYQMDYFFGRTGGGAKIRTTIDTTVDLDSFNSYFATPGLWRYMRSDTVRGISHWLTTGPHTLRFEMVGRDTLSNGWQAILDQILIARDAAKFGTMPQRVTGLTAYGVPGGVRLLWRPVHADTAGHPLVPQSYAIYRAESHDSIYHYLTEVPGTQTSFIDTNLAFIGSGAVLYVVTVRTGVTLNPAVIRVWDHNELAPVDMDNERRR